MSEIKEQTGAEDVHLLFSDSTFPDLKANVGPNNADVVRRLADDSPIWNYLGAGKILVTAYLTYAGGSRERLYRFLFQNRYRLALGIAGEEGGLWRRLVRKFTKRPSGYAGPRAALLIGNRTGYFAMREIRYLQEAARLAGLLIHNYNLVIQEVESRRNRHELAQAGRTQRSLAAGTDRKGRGVHVALLDMPAVDVTGDYMDRIELDRNRVAFLLGDVSGHGLGTGYLVSAFRAIVRSHLESGAGLVETVVTLNQFLLERYRGSEFITLFALVLNTETGQLEYVNAAHPGPYLRRANGDVERISESQRLLGILETEYRSEQVRLETGDRLFLYSDGVTETFNKREETFGDSRLLHFFEDHGGLELETIPQALKAELERFRGSPQPDDDTSVLALEYTPAKRPLRNLMSILRLDNPDN